MNGVDLVDLDRRLEQASRGWRAWRRHAPNATSEQLHVDPFLGRRSTATRKTFESLQKLPEELVERDCLLRWVAALTLDRVTFEDVAEFEVSRRVVRHRVRDLGRSEWSVRDLCLEAVVHPEAGRRQAAGRALLDQCDDASSNALFWLGRRHEAARQLGVDSLRWLEAPLANGLDVVNLARGVIAATDEVAREQFGAGEIWHDVVFAGAGLEAVEGWPAQLTARWMYEMFRPTGLLEGTQFELETVPEARSGASFLRAFDRFGVALYRANARRVTGMFSLAVRPFDPRPASYGSLLSSLLTAPPYLRKHLRLVQSSARTTARALARSMLLNVRMLALQAAVGSCSDGDLARELHAEIGSRALATALPAELAGVFPRYRPTACARLVGALRAATVREQLVQQHDEDWFDNPRAHQYLREIDVTEQLVMDEQAAMKAAATLSKHVSELSA